MSDRRNDPVLNKAGNRRGLSKGSRKGQIPKGVSGNPEGKPPGAPNRRTIIRKVLDQFVAGDIGGKKKKIKLTEAVLLRLAQQALTGDKGAMAMVLKLWDESEEGNERERETVYPFDEKDRQIIDGVYARMKACEEDDWLA